MGVGADIALESRRIYEWALDPLYRARSGYRRGHRRARTRAAP